MSINDDWLYTVQMNKESVWMNHRTDHSDHIVDSVDTDHICFYAIDSEIKDLIPVFDIQLL